MKVLVFGGSFDPPHKGHLTLLLAALRQIKPDLALIMPAYQAPLKGSPQASAADRLAMIRLGLLAALPTQWRKKVKIDTRELTSRKKVYAVETLRRLKKFYPKAELHFVTGADSAAAFDAWKNPTALKTLSSWWTAPRPGTAAAIPSFFKKIPGRMPDISSTAARQKLALDEDISSLVNKSVLAHIQKRRLYGGELLNDLKQRLSPGRFAHTLAVARLAKSLAERWKLNTEQALQAGLLHDSGRFLPKIRMAAYARSRRLKVPEIEKIAKHNPMLMHAYISEDLARHRYGVSDPAVLRAIRRHTLGGPQMHPLDRLLYVADTTSGDRRYPNVESLRSLAFEDLDLGFRACVAQKISTTLKHKSWIHPLTISLWNGLVD